MVIGVAKKVGPRLREHHRRVDAEVVSNSSNKIHQTWEPPFSRALYVASHLILGVVRGLPPLVGLGPRRVPLPLRLAPPMPFRLESDFELGNLEKCSQ